MKRRIFGILLVTILAVPAMTGCQAAKSAGRAVERGMESAGSTLKQAVDPTKATGNYNNPTLTLEEAQNIALKHAGFAANQVTALHAEYEIEHDVPLYDVEFRHGYWEYDYEVHADTGEILSYSKED